MYFESLFLFIRKLLVPAVIEETLFVIVPLVFRFPDRSIYAMFAANLSVILYDPEGGVIGRAGAGIGAGQRVG